MPNASYSFNAILQCKVESNLRRGARFRATPHGIVQTTLPAILAPDRYTQCANVATRVECAKADTVLTRHPNGKVQRIPLAATICDSVIRKDRRPGRTINTSIRFSDF